jgi:integral membrane sensor domain MASE1
VAGRLSLLMAIPPGYATACWPAAGLALACMLVGGAGVWPGVVLGSGLVNVATTFDGRTPAAAIASCAVALSIGLGAGLQAGVGAALVRRFVGYPGALDRDRDIARFLLIAGPVSCLASATWGVTTLLVASRVPPAAYGLNWATWFVGDTIGSVLFAPVALTFLGEPREAWRRRRQTVAVPLAVGFTAVTLLFVRASRRAEAELVELRVEDDGIGLPADMDPRQSTSLGLELIFAFARQLQARVDVRREDGTSFCFTFPSELLHPA